MGPQRNFKPDLLKEDGNDSMKELTYKIEVERKKEMKKYSKQGEGLVLGENDSDS